MTKIILYVNEKEDNFEVRVHDMNHMPIYLPNKNNDILPPSFVFPIETESNLLMILELDKYFGEGNYKIIEKHVQYKGE